jgi:hypothetical protein
LSARVADYPTRATFADNSSGFRHWQRNDLANDLRLGRTLAYVYARDNEAEARQANVLTNDEARRIALNMARLPELLGKAEPD